MKQILQIYTVAVYIFSKCAAGLEQHVSTVEWQRSYPLSILASNLMDAETKRQRKKGLPLVDAMVGNRLCPGLEGRSMPPYSPVESFLIPNSH